jgi:hypothetical protein
MFRHDLRRLAHQTLGAYPRMTTIESELKKISAVPLWGTFGVSATPSQYQVA